MQRPQSVQRLVGLRGTLCAQSLVRRQWLVGVAARQDTRMSGYESGEEGWARLWQTLVSTLGARLHLVHSGSTGKTSVDERGGRVCAERPLWPLCGE